MTESLLKRKKKGFTLIELIVVIAIIAIISLIAIPKVMGYQDNAKKKADVANAKSIANTVAAEIANGNIGTSFNDTFEVTKNTTVATAPADSAAEINYFITKNMQSIPTQQKGSGNFYVNIDANGTVTVLTAAGGTELYPNTATTYK